MKKTLKTIGYFLQWCLYFMITQERRHLYQMGKIKGCRCVGQKSDICGTTYTYSRFEKPVRDFLTWREYWTARGYYSTDKK